MVVGGGGGGGGFFARLLHADCIGCPNLPVRFYKHIMIIRKTTAQTVKTKTHMTMTQTSMFSQPSLPDSLSEPDQQHMVNFYAFHFCLFLENIVCGE